MTLKCLSAAEKTASLTDKKNDPPDHRLGRTPPEESPASLRPDHRWERRRQQLRHGVHCRGPGPHASPRAPRPLAEGAGLLQGFWLRLRPLLVGDYQPNGLWQEAGEGKAERCAAPAQNGEKRRGSLILLWTFFLFLSVCVRSIWTAELNVYGHRAMCLRNKVGLKLWQQVIQIM